MNSYTGPPVYGDDSHGAGPDSGGARTGGSPPSVRQGHTRMPNDLRDQARRLIEARDPQASLTAATLYLQEADRVFAEARQIADRAAFEHERLAAGREHLIHELHRIDRECVELQIRTRELKVLESRLMAQNEALDSREATLKGRESEVVAHKEALEGELKRLRRRPSGPVLVPRLAQSGSLDLRPNPRMAKTPGEFMACLTLFRVWSGNRSLRQISDLSGGRISPSGVGNVLRSTFLPQRFDAVDAIVQGCGGNDEDRAAFASAWRRLYMGSTDSTVVDVARRSTQFE